MGNFTGMPLWGALTDEAPYAMPDASRQLLAVETYCDTDPMVRRTLTRQETRAERR
jgi:hypothetical protein